MASAALDLIVQLKGDADKQVQGLSKSILGLGKSAVGVGGIVTKAIGGIALGGAVAGVGALGAALVSGIGDARAAAVTFAQTEAVIKSTGGAAGVTAEQVSEYAASLSAASGASLFGDDQIQQSANLLLTFTNLKGGVLEAATAMSVDLAQAMGGAPADAAVQLGKALNDPIGGISALTRVGVTFTDQQKDQIKTMVEAGDVAGAQAVILAELNKEFGGSAAAAAAADGGFAQFKDRMGELAESVGAQVLPALNGLMGWLNSPDIQAGIEGFVGGLVTGFTAIVSWTNDHVVPAISSIWNAIQLLATGDFTGGIFGWAEDSPWINALFVARDAILAVGMAFTDIIPQAISIATTAFNLARDGILTFIAAYNGDWQNSDKILLIHQVFGVLGQVIGGVVVPAIQSMVGWFQQNTELVTKIGIAVGVAVAVFQTLSTVVAVVGTVTTAITGMGTAITAAGGIIGTIVAILGGPLTIALGAVALAAGALALAWQTNFGGIQEKTAAVWSFIQSATEPVIATLTRFATEVQPMMAAAWANIQSIVTAAWQAVSSVITTVGGAILGFIQSHMAQIQAITQGVWTVIQGIVQTAWALISGVIKTGLSVLAGDWSGAWNAIKEMASGVWEGIKTIISGAITVIKNEAAIAWDAIKTTAITAWEALRGAVAEKIGAVVAIVSALPGQIVGALSGLAGQLVSIGAAAIQGLINGLKSINIGSVLGSIISGGIAAAKAAAGIHSPSTVTRDEIGKPMGEGIVLGLLSTEDSIKQAMGKIMLGMMIPGAAAVTAVKDVLVGGFADVPEAMAGKIKQTVENVEAHFRKLVTSLQETSGKVKSILGQIIPPDAIAFAGKLGSDLGASIVGGFDSVAPMEQITDKIKSMLGQTIPADAVPFAGELGGNLGAAFHKAFKSEIDQGIPGAIAEALGKAERSDKGKSGDMGDLGQYVTQGSGRLGSSIAEAAADIGNQAGVAFVGSIGEALDLTKPVAIKDMTALFADLRSDAIAPALLAGGDQLYLNGLTWPAKLRSGLLQDTSPLSSAGGDLGSAVSGGIAIGINAGTPAIQAAARQAAQAALAAAKAELGIASPSKKFYEIGENIVTGLINAVEAMTPEAAKALAKAADEWMAPFERLSGFAGVFGSLGTAAANRLLTPLKGELSDIDAQLKNLDVSIYDEFIGADNQRLVLLNQQAAALAEQERLQQKLVRLQEQQQELGWLQQQLKLIDLINTNGLNPADILGGLQLGRNASPEGILDAMTRAMEMIVEQMDARLRSTFPEATTNSFAGGVTNFKGGLAYVHQGEVLANLAPGTDVLNAATVRSMPNLLTMPNLTTRSNVSNDNRVVFEDGAITIVAQPGEDVRDMADRLMPEIYSRMRRDRNS